MQSTFALAYLVQLALSRISGFFVHWYSDGTRTIYRGYRDLSLRIENVVAMRAMLHLLFRPLYGDYSITGRIIGPIFRFGRLLFGALLHLVVALVFIVIWLLWIAVPPFLATYATGLLSR